MSVLPFKDQDEPIGHVIDFVFIVSPTNTNIYFNNKFLGHGRRQYNQSKWHTLSRLI